MTGPMYLVAGWDHDDVTLGSPDHVMHCTTDESAMEEAELMAFEHKDAVVRIYRLHATACLKCKITDIGEDT